jgi:hypothetical protein
MKSAIIIGAGLGGHAALRPEAREDVKLAGCIKAHRPRLCMADGNRLIAYRM